MEEALKDSARRVALAIISLVFVLSTSTASAQNAELLVDASTGEQDLRIANVEFAGDRLVAFIGGRPQGSRLVGIDTETGEFEPLIDSRSSSRLRRFGDRVVFTDGGDLYLTDATPEGTSLLGEFAVPLEVDPLFQANGRFFFADSSSERSLWSSDFTAEGTVRLSDITDVAPRGYLVRSDSLYFVARECELWVTDGTLEQTRLEMKLDTDSALSPPAECTVSPGPGQRFIVREPAQGIAWLTDGTSANTERADHLATGILFTTVEDEVFFVRSVFDEELREVAEIWASDGSAENTRLIEGHQGRLDARDPVFAIGPRFVYPISERELYGSLGTTTGTRLLESFPTRMESFMADGDWVYFLHGNDGELWRTNGTRMFTERIDLEVRGFPNPSSRPYSVRDGLRAVVLDDRIHVGPIMEQAPRVWPPQDRPHTYDSRFGFFKTFGDRAIFTVPIREGCLLWSTDGTPSGTQKIGEYRSPRVLELIEGSQILVEDNGVLFRQSATSNDSSQLGTFLDSPDFRPPNAYGYVRHEGVGYLSETTLRQDDTLEVVVSRVDLRGLEEIARKKWALEDLEEFALPLKTWVDRADTLVIDAGGCRQIHLELASATFSIEQGRCHRASAPIVLGDTTLEFFRDGTSRFLGQVVARRDGSSEVVVWSGSFPEPLFPEGGFFDPLVVEGRAYFVTRETGSFALWTTDGSSEGTFRIAENLIETLTDGGVVSAGNAVVWSGRVEGSDERHLFAYRPSDGVFELEMESDVLNPIELSFIRAGGIAAAGDRIVLAARHVRLGVEPTAIDFDVEPVDGANADEGASDDADDETERDLPGDIGGSGCGCSSSGPSEFWPGLLVFMAIGIVRTRRRASAGSVLW